MAEDRCSPSRSCEGEYICIRHKVQYWKKSGTPLSLPTHFRAANEGGYTQSDLSRATIEAAKRDGREIERVR